MWQAHSSSAEQDQSAGNGEEVASDGKQTELANDECSPTATAWHAVEGLLYDVFAFEAMNCLDRVVA